MLMEQVFITHPFGSYSSVFRGEGERERSIWGALHKVWTIWAKAFAVFTVPPHVRKQSLTSLQL